MRQRYCRLALILQSCLGSRTPSPSYVVWHGLTMFDSNYFHLNSAHVYNIHLTATVHVVSVAGAMISQECALQLLDDMCKQSLQTTSSTTAAMLVCSRAGRWQEAPNSVWHTCALLLCAIMLWVARSSSLQLVVACNKLRHCSKYVIRCDTGNYIIYIY